MIGSIKFEKIDEIKKEAEIGYFLKKDSWAQGYMTEVDFERNIEKIVVLDDSVNINCVEEKLSEIINNTNKKDDILNIYQDNLKLNSNAEINENIKYISNDIDKGKNINLLYKLRKDILGEKLLRITIPSKIAKKIDLPNIKKVVYNNSTFFQNRDSSKLSGIKYICNLNNIKYDKILVISDNIQDEELFENIKHSVSPLYQEKIHKKSRYILNLCHLTFIIK